MRKGYLFPMLAVFISVLTVVSAHALEVEVESVSLTRVGSTATYRWSAVIRNKGENSGVDNSITLQGAMGDEGNWKGASGTSVQLPPAEGTVSSGTISFVRAANTPKLKITAWKNGPLAFAITDLPPEPVPTLEVSNCIIIDDGKFSIDITNVSSEGIGGLSLRTYTANYLTPDNWTLRTQVDLGGLDSLETITKISYRRPESALYKATVIYGGAIVAEQVFDLRTPEQIQALAGPGQEESQEAASATKKAAPMSRTLISTTRATIEGRGAVKKVVPIERIRQY